MTVRPRNGTALFYHRDSDGKAVVAPCAYVEQVVLLCQQKRLQFGGTVRQIEEMIRTGTSIKGDLFLDYGVKGNLLVRPGLEGLIQRASTDLTVSHVMIPRTDRLARPEVLTEALSLEKRILDTGVTLIYFLEHGIKELSSANPEDQLLNIIQRSIAFDRAAKERSDLGRKVLSAQCRGAREGYSTGGQPPYGFRRYLVASDGTVDSELSPGTRTKRDGLRVRFLPGPEEELRVIRRIMHDLKSGKSPGQIAVELNREGVPAPSARPGQVGIHQRALPRMWTAQTIRTLAKNPLLQGVKEFGRRSSGDTHRFSSEGPRPLTAAEMADKRKIMVNPEEQRIRFQASFDPIVSAADQAQVIEILNRRGRRKNGSAIGRSQQRRNASWIFDLNCELPMYRYQPPPNIRFRCSLNNRSNGKLCGHNTIDGRAAYQFASSLAASRLVASAARIGSRTRKALTRSTVFVSTRGGKAKDCSFSNSATAWDRSSVSLSITLEIDR